VSTVPTSLDPWREKGIPLDKQFRSWRERVKTPYDKQAVDPYTRCRVPLGPAAPPEREQGPLTGPEPPLATIHPAPATEGLLPLSELRPLADPPALQEPPA
jgi:hypothetical protein